MTNYKAYKIFRKEKMNYYIICPVFRYNNELLVLEEGRMGI